MGIAQQRTIVLLVDVYAVPGLLEKEPREDLLGEVYQGLVKTILENNALLVVKLRPGMSSRATAAAELLHQRYARECGITDTHILIAHESLIFPFIAACNLMVTFDSAAGAEAILLGKPVINRPLSESDPFGYTATGAAIRVQSAAEIEAAVRDLLRDRQAQERLAQARALYREHYFHAFDGHVAARQAQALSQALEEAHAQKSTPE